MPDRKPKPVRAWAVVTIAGNIVRNIEGAPHLFSDALRADAFALKHASEFVAPVLIVPETPDA